MFRWKCGASVDATVALQRTMETEVPPSAGSCLDSARSQGESHHPVATEIAMMRAMRPPTINLKMYMKLLWLDLVQTIGC